jgi:MFS-type transporter involved in bile tolerance (Atg22 family)
MGGFWALVNINSLPMVYDLGEQRNIGAYTGLYYFSSSAAAIFGPLLAGAIVQALGNNYTIIWLFSAVFMTLAVVAMLNVRPKTIAKAQPAAA